MSGVKINITHTVLRPLPFTRLLMSLTRHSVRMFVQSCCQPIFRNIAAMANSSIDWFSPHDFKM